MCVGVNGKGATMIKHRSIYFAHIGCFAKPLLSSKWLQSDSINGTPNKIDRKSETYMDTFGKNGYQSMQIREQAPYLLPNTFSKPN